MLAKGKAPKVLIAAETQEPVADIPEGRWGASPALLGLYGQSLTAQQVESLHPNPAR
ncbi:hypothetical protein VRRI112168_03655 [Vreelandella rituensis]